MPRDVPTTGLNVGYKGEKPPVMPVVATEHTVAGAKAFAAFFVKTIDWGYVTTSSAYMRHYYVKTCDLCTALAADLDATRAKKHHYLGDRFTISSARQSSEPTVFFGSERTIDLNFSVSATTSVDELGRIKGAQIPISGGQLQIWLDWNVSEWSTVLMNRAK